MHNSKLNRQNKKMWSKDKKYQTGRTLRKLADKGKRHFNYTNKRKIRTYRKL